MGDIWPSFPTSAQPESAAARRTPHLLRSARPDAAAPQHELVGCSPRVLAGRYQIEGAIGRGSMGTVFRARDLQLNSLCAIKMLHHKALHEEADFQRFTNEAAIIARLFHPNIVEVRAFSRDERGGPFLVMELLHGFDLYSQLPEGRKLPLERVQLVVRQVASALHAAHSLGIIHRDIKPRNIFLAQQSSATGGLAEIVKVVDFGLSKIRGQQPQTAPGEILGTPEYLAPEGTLGRSMLIDERTDQWALAITAYRMLAGQLPFMDEDVVRLLLKIRQEPLPLLSSYAVQVPDYVTQALTRALSKRKEDRFPSVLEFARALYGLPTDPAVVGAEPPTACAAARSAPAGPPHRSGLAARSPSPLLTPEQERQLELLEQTQPIAQEVLDDLIGRSSSPAPPEAAPLAPAPPPVPAQRTALAEPAGAAPRLAQRGGAQRRSAPPGVGFSLLGLCVLLGVGVSGGAFWQARRLHQEIPASRAAAAPAESGVRPPQPPAQAEAREVAAAAAVPVEDEEHSAAAHAESAVGRDAQSSPRALSAPVLVPRRGVIGVVPKPGAAVALRPGAAGEPRAAGRPQGPERKSPGSGALQSAARPAVSPPPGGRPALAAASLPSSREGLAGAALGREALGKDAVGRGSSGSAALGRDVPEREALGKQSSGKEVRGSDALAKGNPGKEALGKEANGKEAAGKEALGKESLGKESLEKESLGKESLAREALGREALGKEAPPKEILPKETLPKETLPKDAPGKALALLRPGEPLSRAPASARGFQTAAATAAATAVLSRRPERLSGVEPQLPAWAHSVLGHDPVTGNYLICIGPSGAVERVAVLASIPPADEVIIQALRTWRYPPRAGALCFQQELHFMTAS